jgi:hypothetical protein
MNGAGAAGGEQCGVGGWRGGSACSAQQLRLVRERTEVAALQENCFDAELILQDPTIAALEPT